MKIDGRFVRNTGTREDYCVHLGTAAIQIDPGNYLCVIPAWPANSNREFYLPFSDSDSKTVELVSNIYMLSDDAAIKDKSILARLPGSDDRLSRAG